MKRLLTATVGSVLAAALIAPTAHGATQIRQFEGDFAQLPQPVPEAGGQISLEFVFKNTRGNKGKFTPRQLRVVGLADVPLRCMSSPSGPTESASLTTSIPTLIKLTKTPRAPSQARAKASRYSYSFSSSFSTLTGTLSGRVYKVNGRGPVRLLGKLTIQRFDFPAPGPTSCSTGGVRDWAAG